MAAIDYGVLVFKNGEQIYKEKLYPVVNIGDFVIECYKIWCDIYSTRSKTIVAQFMRTERYHGTYKGTGSCRKSAHYLVGPLSMHLKELCRRVIRITIDTNSDHYTIIYGYGIDNDPRVWKRCKVDYLGRKGARIVDKAIRRAKWNE